MAVAKVKVGSEIKYPSGSTVPTVSLSGLRKTVNATPVSSAAQEIPSGSRVVAVRAFVGVWIRWGASDVGDAAKDDDSQAFPPGEIVIPVPIVSDVVATHFKVLLDGADEGYVQVEQVAHASTIG